MTALESLPGIGPKLSADLRDLGADAAAARLDAAVLRDCTHARRALHGALAGVHWTSSAD
jgi:hypothetical protein